MKVTVCSKSHPNMPSQIQTPCRYSLLICVWVLLMLYSTYRLVYKKRYFKGEFDQLTSRVPPHKRRFTS